MHCFKYKRELEELTEELLTTTTTKIIQLVQQDLNTYKGFTSAASMSGDSHQQI